MDTLNFVWVGAAFGIIASAWRNIRTVGWKFCTFFVSSSNLEGDTIQQTVMDHLISHYHRSSNYDKVYSIMGDWVRPRNAYGSIAYEQFGKNAIVFWKGWIPFLFYGTTTTTTTTTTTGFADTSGSSRTRSTSIMYLRGTLDIDAIIAQATNERNELVWSVQRLSNEASKRFFVRHVPAISDIKSNGNSVAMSQWSRHASHRVLNYQIEEIGEGKKNSQSLLDQLIFPDHVKKIIEQVKLWRNNKEWFQSRLIPWKSGLLLYGPPGTGKSALARAFAEDLDMPIFVYNLAEVFQFEFMKAWQEMQSHVPCIALCEDFDTVFHGRDYATTGNGGTDSTSFASLLIAMQQAPNQGAQPINHGGKLNFGTFLNCLDGVERSEGVFTIITTNDITKIDSALGQPRTLPDGTVEFISSRPGRIDNAVELTYINSENKQIMAKRIVGEYPTAYKEILEFLARFPDYQETPAQFQKRCTDMALKEFYAIQQKENSVIMRLDDKKKNSAA